MIGSSPSQQRLADDRDKMDRQPFLATHRALAACTREFARLTEEIVDGVAALPEVEEKAVVRQSPGRCIVQLGPVALTVAWLRSTLDSAADGQLLAIVWHGNVAPRAEHRPEVTARRTPAAAVALWEESLVAAGTSEAEWGWRPEPDDATRVSSSDLAKRCVERLHRAYVEHHGPA